MNSSNRWKGIMKCYPFSEDRLSKWEPPYIVQPKFDGVRCRAIPLQIGPKGNEYLLLSSEENIIYSVPHINQAFSNLHLNAEFDGELYCHGKSFEEIVSITSRTVNPHPDALSIQFHLFDIVIDDQPQMRRTIICENLRNLNSYIQVSPFWLCESLDDIMRAYDKLINLGYEGIIVRHNQAPYERKRSTLIMKFKGKREDDYKIVGYKEEITIDGSPKNTLGALECISGDGNTFFVGTGFTDDLRYQLWKDKENLIGKIAKIKYQHLTDRKIPRFPVFTEVID